MPAPTRKPSELMTKPWLEVERKARQVHSDCVCPLKATSSFQVLNPAPTSAQLQFIHCRSFSPPSIPPCSSPSHPPELEMFMKRSSFLSLLHTAAAGLLLQQTNAHNHHHFRHQQH